MMFKCDYSLIRNKLWRNCKMCLLAKPTNRHSLWKCICPSIRVVVYGFKNTTRSEYNESRTWLDWKFEKLWSNKSLDWVMSFGTNPLYKQQPSGTSSGQYKVWKEENIWSHIPISGESYFPTSNQQPPGPYGQVIP